MSNQHSWFFSGLLALSLTFLAPNVFADEQEDDAPGHGLDGDLELMDFDVQRNAKVIFAYQESDNGVSSEIQAYHFRYPTSHRPRKISRWAIKRDLEMVEQNAGLGKRGRHNPLQVQGTKNVEINGKTFLQYPWKVRNKDLNVYAWTSNQNVVLVRVTTTSNNTDANRNKLAEMNRVVRCLCQDKC